MKKKVVLKQKWSTVLKILACLYFVIGSWIFCSTLSNNDSIKELLLERLEKQSQLEESQSPKKISKFRNDLREIDTTIIEIEYDNSINSSWISFLTPLGIAFAILTFAISLDVMGKTTSIGDNSEQKKDKVVKRYWIKLKDNLLKNWRKLKDDYTLGYLWLIVAFVILIVGIIITFNIYHISTELIEASKPNGGTVEKLQLKKETRTFQFNLLTIAGLVATVAAVGFSYTRKSPKVFKNEKLNHKSI